METIEILNKFYSRLSEQKLKKNIGKYVKESPKILTIIHNRAIIVTNFGEICNKINRNPNHIKDFIEVMLFEKILSSNESKIALSNEKLVISAMLPIENVKASIKKYINLYVECAQCKNLNTELIKEVGTNMIKCLACNSIHPVKKY
jgi:translation initiation factor 2 subunit 2